VRLESPVQTFFRTTTRPCELAGAHLPEGLKVLMFLGSANRDPRRWERAGEYDIERTTAGHVGFGFGIHVCVGQLLARLEAEALLGSLAAKVRAIESMAPPVLRFNNTLRGLASLPARLVAH
jgi:4-methoxybenzoate monooxygenase (O-demethylating)